MVVLAVVVVVLFFLLFLCSFSCCSCTVAKTQTHILYVGVCGQKRVYCLNRYGNAASILPDSPCLLIRKRQNAAVRLSSSLLLLLSLRKKAVELYTERATCK